jgi:hypothetical protein
MRWIALPLIGVAIAGVIATAATAQTDARSVIVATTPSTAPPLATGIADPVFEGPEATTAYAMASQAGARYVRLAVTWASIAPTTLPGSGFDPTDPTSPYYQWSSLDASVSAAQAAGITPILDIMRPAPAWAYAVPPGTSTVGSPTGGSPRIADLHAFATALAIHYDGSGPAPAAHVFSVWNEVNYNKNLYPQNPAYYRAMVNAVASAVHGVDPANLVLAGELAPFRNLKTDMNHAIPPLSFMRTMLCLSKTAPVHRTCSAPAEFDVWTHHPYSNNGPYGHAKSSDGVELGDLPKMYALLRTAQRLGAIVSAQPVQLWVTEVGWNSNAPNSKGVPMQLETRWVAESMYQMWKCGVAVGTWFLLEDMPTRFQSGLYFRSGPSLADASAKPLLAPFELPFVAYLKPGGKVQVWGRDATSDQQDVTIDMKVGGRWTTVATITSNGYGIFQATLAVHALGSYSMRASANGVTSAVFSLKVPANENLTVTPFPLG